MGIAKTSFQLEDLRRMTTANNNYNFNSNIFNFNDMGLAFVIVDVNFSDILSVSASAEPRLSVGVKTGERKPAKENRQKETGKRKPAGAIFANSLNSLKSEFLSAKIDREEKKGWGGREKA